MSLPWGRLRGGTGGARMLPAWADRNGSASRLPLSRLQLLGAAGTAGGLKQMWLGWWDREFVGPALAFQCALQQQREIPGTQWMAGLTAQKGYSVKFRYALLRKWELGDGRVSLPSSPPSLGSFLANLKSSRTLAGFFANQCGGKNEVHQWNSGWISAVSCSAWWGVVTREPGKTLWKHRTACGCTE